MATDKINKLVLSYSGGLDTSVMLRWIKDHFGCEVVAYCADVGQGDVPWTVLADPEGNEFCSSPRANSISRGHRRVIVASHASTRVVPSTGLMSKLSAVSDSTTQPSLNAARSSSARTRRGPQVPGCRSLKHTR